MYMDVYGCIWMYMDVCGCKWMFVVLLVLGKFPFPNGWVVGKLQETSVFGHT